MLFRSEHQDWVKNCLDSLSVCVTFASVFDVISPIYGFVGAVVGIMRIIEMMTGEPFSQVIKRALKKKDDAK